MPLLTHSTMLARKNNLNTLGKTLTIFLESNSLEVDYNFDQDVILCLFGVSEKST